jgi:hypothetical protein
MEKRTINADEYIQQMLGDVDGAYTLSFDTLTLLLRTYGKELILECVDRVETTHLGNNFVVVDANSITSICDEL